MIKLLIALLLCLSHLSAMASSQEELVKLRPRTRSGRIDINAYHYLNIWGKREVRLEAATLPAFGKTNPILGYGRDTTDDGRIDSWFILDEDEGLILFSFTSNHIWGRPELLNKVFLDYESSVKAHVAAFCGRVFGLFLISVNNTWKTEREYWQEKMDLMEMRLRLERLRASGNLSSQQWQQGISVVASGHQSINQRLHHARNRGYLELAAADVAMWGTGGIIFKWMGKGFAAIGRSVIPGQLQSEIKSISSRLIEKAIQKNGKEMAQLRKLVTGSSIVVSANLYKTKFAMTMRAVRMKNQIINGVVHHAPSALKRAGLENWKYFSAITGTQFVAEGVVNWSDIRHPNPAMVAANVLTNPGIMANVGFMASDAYLMKAAELAIKPGKMRYAAFAFIPIATSSIINIFIQGKDNYFRLGIDMMWEMTVGPAQLKLDGMALKKFEALAVKQGKSGLKHVGWVVILVEQAVMFGVYSTQVGARFDSPQVQLVPVLVEDS